VDTESNSLHAFREQVCLIQFFPPLIMITWLIHHPGGSCALGPLFSNPAIEKFFHALNMTSSVCGGILALTCQRFRYMIAGASGTAEVGLAAMLEAQFGVVLDKIPTRQLGTAPLLPAMLASPLDTIIFFHCVMLAS